MKFLKLPFFAFSRRMGIVYGIMVLCLALEALLLAADFGLVPVGRLRQNFYDYAGFWPGLLNGWTPNYTAQPYVMFVSYSFLHSGVMHVLVNMYMLYTLGHITIERVGPWGFFWLYGAAVFGGAMCFGLLAQDVLRMVGASGGLFGLLGGLLAWNYVDRFLSDRRVWPVLRAVFLLVLLNVVMWWVMNGHLAWQTHLGGFLAGWVAALLIDPRGQTLDPADDKPSET